MQYTKIITYLRTISRVISTQLSKLTSQVNRFGNHIEIQQPPISPAEILHQIQANQEFIDSFTEAIEFLQEERQYIQDLNEELCKHVIEYR